MPRTSGQLTSRTGIDVANVHVDALMKNLSVAYMPQGLIAEEVAVVIPVTFENDIYTIWDADDVGRTTGTNDLVGPVVADGAEPSEVGLARTEGRYACDKYAYSIQITDRQRANSDAPLQLELVKTNFVQKLLLLEQERRVAALFASATEVAAAAAWDAGEGGDPEGDLDGLKNTIRLATNGDVPTDVIIPYQVALKLKKHAQLRDLLRWTHSDLLVNGDLPPTIFNLKVHIPASNYTSTREGQATQTHTNVWGDSVQVFIKGPVSLQTRTAVAIPRVSYQVKRWRWEHRSTSLLSPQYIQDEIIISSPSIRELTGVLA